MKKTRLVRIFVLVAFISISVGSIFAVPTYAKSSTPTEAGWTQVVDHADVDILACRKGRNLKAGFKLLAYRHRFAVRKINMNVIYNGKSHWVGKYEAWNEIRSYAYNSTVPNRSVTLMVKNRNGSNLLFSGFVYNELRAC